ncbi:copper resistance protein CopC [Spongiactinospora sp. TRM90649]|uniref:copper resistance CopC family protein n=1 Tax=Spongiactinospora sp. TRM90649 TaxID=3031114 RepID=UPI0023F9549C|nr:copper resistance protein CopC [Spongiactinospora sp. TRM90649]MDF5756988.1 copper resistance protein CopC [Spongiactinospora sp. TRM90649]
MRRIARDGLVVALGCALSLAFTAAFAAPAALAHDRLKSSSPAKDAKVSELKEIKLDFTSGIKFPVVVLHDTGGEQVKLDKPEADGHTVVATVPEPLASGRYVIAWRVVSTDGHPIEGEIPFKVDAPKSESPEATAIPEATESAETTPSDAASTSAAPPVSPVDASGELQSAEQGVPGWVWLAGAAVVVVGAGIWVAAGRRRGGARPEA